MDGIGPEVPLSRDHRHGVYALITTYKEEIKQNFKNLLLTSPGERVMNPDFGVGLRRYLFEFRDHSLPLIRQRIEQQVSKYMPFIRINKIDLNTDEMNTGNPNIISIKIIYDVPNMNIQSSIILKGERDN